MFWAASRDGAGSTCSEDIASVHASPMAVWDPVLWKVLPGKWSMCEERDEKKERQKRGRAGQREEKRRENEGRSRELVQQKLLQCGNELRVNA